MEILLLPILGILIYYFIFRESKSDLRKMKEALKDTSTDDLMFVNKLIENELKKR
tara:strand:+ start:273 stop:437 length:165 start_codon:yes stop_codon:yes gene_type:complete